MLRRDLSSNRLARRRTPPVRQQLAPPARAENPLERAATRLAGVGRGHAAPVEPVSTSQRYAAAVHRVNSTTFAAGGRPTDDPRASAAASPGDTPRPGVNLWRTGCRAAALLLGSGHRAHRKSGQAPPKSRSRTLHTLWTKVWIGKCGPSRRNSYRLAPTDETSPTSGARNTRGVSSQQPGPR